MFQILYKNKSGFMLLEVIVAIALITIAFVSLLGVAAMVFNVSGSVRKQTQADFLIKEEFEALRNYRDGTTWTTNGLGTAGTGSSNPYHLVNSENKWTLVAGPETTDIFSRNIVFDKVSRDTGGNIQTTYNPSANDPDTIKVTVTVSWTGKIIQDVSYLTNWSND